MHRALASAQRAPAQRALRYRAAPRRPPAPPAAPLCSALAPASALLRIRKLSARRFKLCLPLGALRAQRIDLRLRAVTRFSHKADFGLKAAELRLRFIQGALRARDCLIGAPMFGAQCAEPRFDSA